jgi:hypothetical protein
MSQAKPAIPSQPNAEAQHTLSGRANVANANVVAAYEAAISLWTYEGQMIWARYNAMLIANSVVLAAIGLTAGNQDTALVFRAGLPVAGILLCLLWWSLLARGFDYYAYWILSARELEELYLAPDARTVSRGAAFAAGRPVYFKRGDQEVPHQLSRASRLLRVRHNSHIVLLVFAVLYVLSFFQAVLQ